MNLRHALSLALTNPAEAARRAVRKIKRRLMPGPQRYIDMQKAEYDHAAAASSFEHEKRVDLVVGSYDAQNQWPDYETYLMRYVDDSYIDKVALDFGCGPGRNLILYHGRFARIDGADISAFNLDNARKNLALQAIPIPNLYQTNGDDLGSAPSDHYDYVFSTIALQHICVHEIRQSIFAHMARVLKPGGRLSAQMGYGADSPYSVDYYANFYDAPSTNRGCDTRVESPDQLRRDLESVGLSGFESWVRPTGPGDLHPNWIFFTAVKGA